MTFENKSISITELEPLVEKIEIIASTLDQYLLACTEFGQPPQEFSASLGTELREALDLREWLNDLR